jgi:hypothetical protein
MVYGSFNRDPAGSASWGESIAETLPAGSRLNVASTPEPAMNVPARFSLVVALAWCALSSRSLAADPTPLDRPKAAQILAELRPGHPRLIAPASRFDELRRDVKSDATLTRWYESIRSDGEGILRARPSQYEIPDGLRLLATSRRVLDRVATLALLYRIDGDGRWVERAWIASRRWRCCTGSTATAAGSSGPRAGGGVEIPGLEPAAFPGHGRDDRRLCPRLRLVARPVDG